MSVLNVHVCAFTFSEQLSIFSFTKKGLGYIFSLFLSEIKFLFRSQVLFFQTNKFSDSLIYFDKFSNFERYKVIHYSFIKHMFIYNNEYKERKNKTRENNKKKDSELLKN